MVARLVHQDDGIREEFLKRIKAKVQAEREAMKGRLEEVVPSLLATVLKPVFGVAFDISRGIDKFKGNSGEVNVSVKLRLGLSDEWVLMNDVIVEPEPEVFAQTDHVLIGPPGLFIIETKAWQGAFSGYKDYWKRKEGNQWVKCESPTKQNQRHVRLIRKWLEGTGLVKINELTEGWIQPAVVFTNASWLKVTECSMPVFDGPLQLLGYLRQQKARILPPEQIDKIAGLLAYPAVAKAFTNKEIQLLYDEQAVTELQKGQQSIANLSAEQPVVEEGKNKDGRKFVRITGTVEQAKEIRQKYLQEGQNPGKLSKDRYKQGIFYFYIEA